MRRIALPHCLLTALAILLVMAGAACRTSSTSVTSPTTTITTETFSGTISQSGTGIHSFTVSTTGTVTIALTAVKPLTTMALGVAIATWDGSACSSTAMSKNDDARAGSTALTGTATSGNYCIRVYDSGNVPTDWSVTYSVQVAHP